MKKVTLTLLYIFLAVSFIVAMAVWTVALTANVRSDEPVRITVPSGSTFEDLLVTMKNASVLRNENSFILTARLKPSGTSVRTGSYIIKPGMSNNKIVNMLRSGREAPVNVTFNNIRTLDELAGRIGSQIEEDSAMLSAFFHDVSNYTADGFDSGTVISVFIPDTYQVYWTIDAGAFYRRMLREYRAYWNEERMAEAEEIGLTPVEVSVLASIVDEETTMADEKARIAGVYLNRLRQGIPLQADPTVKFAVNDFTLRRVLKKHTEVNSPYNTYLFRGLPPGPIRCPSKSGLEAVLNAEKHEYYYFVARPDGSGYHHFSRTLAEHNRYASAYRSELNRRRIYN